jgi:uncharacterized protein
MRRSGLAKIYLCFIQKFYFQQFNGRISNMHVVYIAILAVIMEFIDSALGMFYGTVLSPFLIIMNYNAKDVVPSILISQAIGGGIASWRHHRYKNADFSSGTTDRRIAVHIIWAGVFACLLGAFVSISIPTKILNTYIGTLVVIISILILCNCSLIMTNGKIFILGAISAFNKALSGGGFGPLVAGGQLIFRDRSEKGAIGSTDFAEAPICLFSFFLWVCFKGFPPAALCLPLCIGSAIGGFFGPMWLNALKSRNRLKKVLSVMILLEGLWVIYKAWIR